LIILNNFDAAKVKSIRGKEKMKKQIFSMKKKQRL